MGDSAVSIAALTSGSYSNRRFRRRGAVRGGPSRGRGGRGGSPRKPSAATLPVQPVPSATEADPLRSTVPENTEDSPKRYICDVCGDAEFNFSTDSLAEWEAHLFSYNHQSLSKKREVTQDILDRNVFVTGIPTTVTDHEVFKHFSKYGDVVNCVSHMNRSPQPSQPFFSQPQTPTRFYFVEYPFKQVADDVKRLRHTINGFPVTVAGRKVRAPAGGSLGEEPNSEKPFLEESMLLKIVKKGTTPLDQIYSLRKHVELTARDLEERTTIVQYVAKLCSKFYPHCHVVPFGSTSNGLGFRGCDLDMHLDMGFPLQTGSTDGSVISDLLSGDCYYTPSPEEHVNRAVQVLQSDASIEKLKVIPGARIPVVKFRFSSYSMNCDLIMGSKLPIRTTALIRTLVTQDTRVRNYFFLLKWWAKREGVVGPRKGDNFNSYSFTLLIIFFLQQLDIPVLPPISTLQNIALGRGLTEHYIEGWNANFIEDNLPRVSLSVPIEQLIFDFFDFYSQFDFGLLAICPLLGQTLPRSALLDFDLMPDGLDLYRANVENGLADRITLNTFVCIQDPFELNFNVAKNVNVRGVQNFQTKCSHYREVTAVFTSKPVEVVAINKRLRHRLYPVLDMAFGGSVASSVIMRKGVPKRILEQDKIYHATVSFPMEKFRNLYPNEDDPATQSRWIAAMTSSILDYFKRVLHVEIRDVTNVAKPTEDGSSPIDYEKMAKHLEIKFDPRAIPKEAREGKGDSIIKVLYIEAYYTTWEKRKRYQLMDEFQGDRGYLEREEEISTRMIAHTYPTKPDLPRSCFICEIRRKDHPCRLFLMMTDVASVKRTLKTVCNFMRKTMTSALNSILEGCSTSPNVISGEPEVEMVEWSDDEDEGVHMEDVKNDALRPIAELFQDYDEEQLMRAEERRAETRRSLEEGRLFKEPGTAVYVKRQADADESTGKRKKKRLQCQASPAEQEVDPSHPSETDSEAKEVEAEVVQPKELVGWYDPQPEPAAPIETAPSEIDQKSIPSCTPEALLEVTEPLFCPAKEGEIPGLNDG